ncbi:MAG: hypothetical protein R6W78_11650 [Bacteroidales bacterium]
MENYQRVTRFSPPFEGGAGVVLSPPILRRTGVVPTPLLQKERRGGTNSPPFEGGAGVVSLLTTIACS